MAYVLRTWLGNPAVVTVEECNSGSANRVHLRVDTGPRKIIIDMDYPKAQRRFLAERSAVGVLLCSVLSSLGLSYLLNITQSLHVI
jgi:hypothetical protein